MIKKTNSSSESPQNCPDCNEPRYYNENQIDCINPSCSNFDADWAEYVNFLLVAKEWALKLDEIHKAVFIGPGPHPFKDEFEALEQKLHDLAIQGVE